MFKVTFSIPYETEFGQQLIISGYEQDNTNEKRWFSKKMIYNNGIWEFTINIKNNTFFSYSYSIEDSQGTHKEAGAPRKLTSSHRQEQYIYDFWRARDNNSPFLSTPFLKVLKKNRGQIHEQISGNLRISTLAHNIPDDLNIYIVGNCKELGDWNPGFGKKMNLLQDGSWAISLDIKLLPKHTEYKYILLSEDDKIIIWEEGENRVFTKPNEAEGIITTVNDYPVKVSFPKIRLAGTALPLFAIKSETSCGIGDFGDLDKFVNLVKESGMNVLQLLPINDTTHSYTWRDSYPYSAISGYALHPVYMDLDELGKIKDREFRERHLKKREKLNSSKKIEWDSVIRTKWLYIRQIFNQEWEKTSKTKEFRTFYKKNESWLLPYAMFSHLRDRYKTSDFRLWPRFNVYKKDDIIEMLSEKSKCQNELHFYFFVQYNLHKQLDQVHKKAVEKGIILKGDIPIGIHRNSVEAWTEPHLFNFNMKAGAPPDYFSSNGQIWGFPIYNWDSMEKENFRWWISRLEKMSEYFDAFRIDHILGFFRIWQVPLESSKGSSGYFEPSIPYSTEEIHAFGFTESTSSPLFITDSNNPAKFHPAISAKSTPEYSNLGKRNRFVYNQLYHNYFYERNESLWEKNGYKRLQPIISCTNMLACAEDLGMIPDCVPKVMGKLKILSLELERMPKAANGMDGKPDKFPYLSVATTSSHDTEGIREWWGMQHNTLEKTHLGENTTNDTPTDICENIVLRHMLAPSMMAILPFQDLLSIFQDLRHPQPCQERINNPANPDNNWNYRLHISIESLTDNKSFTSKIQEIVKTSGRKI